MNELEQYLIDLVACTVDADERFAWLAFDADGELCGYTKEPEIDEFCQCWFSQAESSYTLCNVPPQIHHRWRESLMRRG